ncbi:MAG: rRNA adenine N-6-methyltransferase family protein, partial [Planctomycetota bacterium]
PLILNCLQLPRPPEAIVVTVQFEAAQRLCAQPGDPAWGASAAVAAAAGHGEILRRLPPGCFWPRPRVDSAILRWIPTAAVPPDFGVWCRRIFAYRRKVARRALRDAGCPRERVPALCAAAGVEPEARIETLRVEQLVALQAHSKEMI